jgi:hypothetical protein
LRTLPKNRIRTHRTRTEKIIRLLEYFQQTEEKVIQTSPSPKSPESAPLFEHPESRLQSSTVGRSSLRLPPQTSSDSSPLSKSTRFCPSVAGLSKPKRIRRLHRMVLAQRGDSSQNDSEQTGIASHHAERPGNHGTSPVRASRTVRRVRQPPSIVHAPSRRQQAARSGHRRRSRLGCVPVGIRSSPHLPIRALVSRLAVDDPAQYLPRSGSARA